MLCTIVYHFSLLGFKGKFVAKSLSPSSKEEFYFTLFPIRFHFWSFWWWKFCTHLENMFLSVTSKTSVDYCVIITQQIVSSKVDLENFLAKKKQKIFSLNL